MEETTMAFVLYFLLEPREIDGKTPDIQQLGAALGRSADAVAMKINNISANDQNRISQGKVGLPHGSKLDKRIWELYEERGDEFLSEGIELLTSTLKRTGSQQPVIYAVISLPEGRERIAEATVRTNQKYFRNSLLDNYQRRCCLTGLNVPELLAASHIKPWKESDPKTERLAPSNGLLLNALHDRAFDRGLITLSRDFRIVVSSRVRHSDSADELLWRYHDAQIELPRRMRLHRLIGDPSLGRAPMPRLTYSLICFHIRHSLHQSWIPYDDGELRVRRRGCTSLASF